MSSPSFLIYALIDPRTRLVRYIGKSTVGMRRPRVHRKPRKNLKTYCASWVRSLIALNLMFEIVVLEHCRKEELDDLECWWIAYGRASGWPLTNLTDGGGGARGYKAPEEVRAANSARGKARFSTPESRAQHGQITKKTVDATPRVVRDAWIARCRDVVSRPEVRSKNSARARSREPVSEETCQRLSTALKRSAARGDDHYSKRPAAREKNRAWHTGRKASDLTLSRMSDAQTEAWARRPERRREQSARMLANPPVYRPEVAAKISAAKLGDKNPTKRPEVQAKLRASWTPERKAAASARMSQPDVQARVAVPWTAERRAAASKRMAKWRRKQIEAKKTA